MSEILNVKVDKIMRLEGDRALKAFVDLCFGDIFSVKGFRIVEGKDKLFIGMPQSFRSGKWYNTFTCVTQELKDYLREVILDAYKAE